MNNPASNNNDDPFQQRQRQSNPQARQRVSFRKQNAIITSDLSFPEPENESNAPNSPTRKQQQTNSMMAKTQANHKPPSLANLNVPHSAVRKMSLQAPSSQLQQQQQQQQPVNSPLLINDQLLNSNSSYATAGATSTSSANLQQAGNTKNSLAVNNHLMSRKSLIGSRLERSSFQAQRLSDVGVAVSQQLTAKIGLKLPASQERIVEQTRWLYLRYILLKLRQNSLPLRDLNLTKSSIIRPDSAVSGAERPLPEITCSAPASAAPATDCSEESPFIEFKMSPEQHRKRSRMSQTVASQDLNIFAARMKSLTATPSQELDSSCSSDIIVNLTSSIDSIDENTFFKSNRTYSVEKKTNFSPNHFTFQRTNFTAGPAINRKYILDTTINNQIFNVILNMISDLRELKPEYYGDTIYELVGIDKFSCLQNLIDLQMRICQEMTRSEITWCRIAALFSLFGAMSLDCVRLGAPEHVGPMLESFMGFVERDLALWISQQGGWESFLYKHKASFSFSYIKPILLLTVIIPIFGWGLMDLFR